MKPNYRTILDRVIDEGVRAGYVRAHKHTDTPSEDDIVEQIRNYLWLSLDEFFLFEDTYNE